MISIDSCCSYNKMKYTNRCDINSNLNHFMANGQQKKFQQQPDNDKGVFICFIVLKSFKIL